MRTFISSIILLIAFTSCAQSSHKGSASITQKSSALVEKQIQDTGNVSSKTAIVVTGKAQRPASPAWIDNAVFYQIYPQTFYDSNGDGVGDLPGIIEKLDYVKSLGIGAVWLNPFYESPFRDAGYDVTDFYKVAPRYGTNDDAKKLFAEVHKRGMHIRRLDIP